MGKYNIFCTWEILSMRSLGLVQTSSWESGICCFIKVWFTLVLRIWDSHCLRSLVGKMLCLSENNTIDPWFFGASVKLALICSILQTPNHQGIINEVACPIFLMFFMYMRHTWNSAFETGLQFTFRLQDRDTIKTFLERNLILRVPAEARKLKHYHNSDSEEAKAEKYGREREADAGWSISYRRTMEAKNWAMSGRMINASICHILHHRQMRNGFFEIINL